MYAVPLFNFNATMTTFLDLKTRLQGVDIEKIASDAVRSKSDDLVEWQKEQLFSGKTSKGTKITPKYKKVTVRIKTAKGQPTDRVTLKDKGDFYDGIIVDIGRDTWNLSSTDEKAYDLMGKYTPYIFGLNKVSLAGFGSDVRPIFLSNLSKATGLPT